MFDTDTLKLNESLRKAHNARLLEAQRQKEEDDRKVIKLFVETLTQQYQAMRNPAIESVIDRFQIIESATIHGVRDTLYRIFESALLIDESHKGLYQGVFKNLFNEKFNAVLKENGVNTLKDFQAHLKNGHPILQTITESVKSFVTNSANIYSELLKTQYNHTTANRAILEAYKTISADDSADDKKEALNKLGTTIMQELNTYDSSTELKIGEHVKQLLILCNKANQVGITQILHVNSYLACVEGVIGDPRHTKYLPTYKKHLIAIRSEILAMVKAKYAESVHDTRLQSIISRINTILATIEKPVQLAETSFMELITEVHAATAENDDQKIKFAFAKIKQKLREVIELFNPYTGLEGLRMVNEIMIDNFNAATYGAIPLVGPFIYVAMSITNSSKVSPAMATQAVKEAETFLATLEQQIRRLHKLNDHANARKLERQYKRLDSFICEYRDDTRKKRIKFMRENDMPLEDLVESAMEMAQYLLVYEVTVEDLTTMFEAVIESADDSVEDRELLLKTVRCETCGQETVQESDLVTQCNCIEAALYESIHFGSPEGLTESAHKRLLEGQLPSEDDYLDDEEKDLVDSIANVNGKGRAVDIIKTKVIAVIESEEERARKREQEEQDILNRMSPDDIENLKNTMNENAGSPISIGKQGLNAPESLFEAIVMNRSKKYIQESTQNGDKFDILGRKETIQAESLVLFTIHETFNVLGFEKYTMGKQNKLMNDYYYGKL